MIKENKARLAEFNMPYDPYVGKGSYIPRELIEFTFMDKPMKLYLPVEMCKLQTVKLLKELKSVEKVLKRSHPYYNETLLRDWYLDFLKTRILYDFEFWAATSYKIVDKQTGGEMFFILNYPQRAILLPAMEKQRFANTKIRINIVKARQWGGSTAVDAYIFYIQNVLKANVRWNSVIIAHVEKAAKNVRAMYRRAARKYPTFFGTITLKSFEQTKDIVIAENETVISVGSMEKPEGVRSDDLKCVHFTEVALWKKTESKSPEDVIQSVHGTLSNEPLSFGAYESTAKGRGNFFHDAWLHSVSGQSAYKPVFVPWFVIQIYQEDYNKEFSVKEFVDTWDEYEWWLWKQGATLSGIYWYRNKLYGEMEGDTWRMRSEFPTTAEEAFQSTGRPVFHPAYLEGLEIHTRVPFVKGTIEGAAQKGKKALRGLRFLLLDKGHLKVWSKPVPFSVDPVKNRYCVSLDIGGAHHESDKSIITVYDRIWLIDGDGELEVVASAEFNMDQDLTVWVAVQIAMWYNQAMFIPEYNSLDTDEDTEGNHFFTILDEIVDIYPNIYQRTSVEDIRMGVPAKYGFHTNKATKTMIIDCFRAILREKKLIEREQKAINEYESYEYKEGGRMGGAGKNHDDYPMSRSIGAWCATKHMELPMRVVIKPEDHLNKLKNHKITGEATI